MNKSAKVYLITGGSGLIGSSITKILPKLIKDKILTPSHAELDITNLDSVKRFFDKHKPDSVIHLAAFRNASEAEKSRGNKKGIVWKANVIGTRNIAKISSKFNSYLIHISTDMIFSGHGKYPGPYPEDHQIHHSSKFLSWYGITKREAENQIHENIKNAAIIRIGNVTGPDNEPSLDYVGKILMLYEKNKLYPLFNDQFVTLTHIPLIADILKILLTRRLKGIFHAASTNLFTPHELASYAVKKIYGHTNTIKSASIDFFLKDRPRRYPKFGGLSSDITQKTLGLKFTTWQKIIDKIFVKNSKI